MKHTSCIKISLSRV